MPSTELAAGRPTEGMTMTFKKNLGGLGLALLVAMTGVSFASPAHSDTPGQERRDERQEGREVRQEGRDAAREAKKECKKGDEKSRAECRQDKRGTKQDAREGARDARRGN
jgi:hypothetical protein